LDGFRRRHTEGISMAIELIEDRVSWDRFIEESPYGLIFHKWDFLKNIEKYLNYELNTYGFYEGSNLIGVLPLYNKKINGLKVIFSPPPKAAIPYLGLVMNKEYGTVSQKKKESFLNLCADEIGNEITKINPNYVSINTVPNFLDVRPFQWNNFSVDPGYTYIIDLTKSLDEIFDSFHRYLRKDIRHAENKGGLKYEVGKDISIFYQMQKQRYEEQNLSDPVENEKYVESQFKAYPDNLKAYYVCNDNGDALGAITTQEYKDRFMTWMGTTRSVEHANEYLMWELIKLAKEKGYRKFELMGAGKRNLCQFKCKFNPSLEVSYSIQKKDTLGKLSEWAYINFVRKKNLI
jgi:hypothetical protein